MSANKSIAGVSFDCFGVLVAGSFNAIYRGAGGDPAADREMLNGWFDAVNGGHIAEAEFERQVAARLGITPEAYNERRRAGERPNEQLLHYIATVLRPHVEKLVITSNAAAGAVEDRLGRAALGLFDAVVESGAVGLVKPDPKIYALAAESAGLALPHMIHVDDDPSYAHAAQAAGMARGVYYQGFELFSAQMAQLLPHSL
jgi:putative hydrolase of the HAD superfamily